MSPLLFALVDAAIWTGARLETYQQLRRARGAARLFRDRDYMASIHTATEGVKQYRGAWRSLWGVL